MQSRSFAPAGRALVFFGFMALAVGAMTFGADLQRTTDQSSQTVAQIKSEQRQTAAADYAARNPGVPERAVQQAGIAGSANPTR